MDDILKMKSARKLVSDIERKIEKWDEYSCFQINGVKNLSMADMDTLLLYANTHLANGSFYGLMKPLGSIAEVLRTYNLLDN